MSYPRTRDEAVALQTKINEEAVLNTEKLAKEVLTAKSFEAVVKIWEDFSAAANSYYDYAVWYPDGQHEESLESQFDEPMDLLNLWPWDKIPTFGPKPELVEGDHALTWNSHKIMVNRDGAEPNEYIVMTREDYKVSAGV